MMLVIEYLNVLLRGSGRLGLFKAGWQQYLIAGFLGALPGCLGPWAIVALYAHGLVSLGALTTNQSRSLRRWVSRATRP